MGLQAAGFELFFFTQVPLTSPLLPRNEQEAPSSLDSHAIIASFGGRLLLSLDFAYVELNSADVIISVVARIFIKSPIVIYVSL